MSKTVYPFIWNKKKALVLDLLNKILKNFILLEPPRERPKLQLAKRSVETASEEKSTSAAANAAIFGGAKPVDTAKKEREIEERLATVAIKEDEAAKEPQKKSADIFGAAKPVDTAAKEREIEEKLKKQEEEMRSDDKEA